MRLYKAFTITGVANVSTADAGISSTKARTRKIIGVILHVSGWIGNQIEGRVDREKILSIYDYSIPTEESSGSTNTQKNTNREAFYSINRELKLGETFAIAILCGGTAKNVFGSYVYEE